MPSYSDYKDAKAAMLLLARQTRMIFYWFDPLNVGLCCVSPRQGYISLPSRVMAFYWSYNDDRYPLFILGTEGLIGRNMGPLFEPCQ